MVKTTQHGDVTQFEFSSARSRSMGFSVSTFMLDGVMIDTAFPVVRRAFSRILNRHTPRGVIVTHYHEDHSGNAGLAASRRIPLWVAPTTIRRLHAPPRILWYRRWCWGSPDPLGGGLTAFDPAPLQCILAPGHSDDHHVVWDPTRSIVFGADLFLGVKVRVSHPWPRENVRQQIASIRRVVALDPEWYFDAHRGLVASPIAQLSAKADWLEETVAQVDALIAQGVDDRQIIRRLFGREDWKARFTSFDYSRRNFVASIRGTYGAAQAARTLHR